MLQIDRGIDNYVGYLAVGVLAFQMTTRVATDATNAVAANEGLIRSVQFPRAVLPITAVLRELFAFGPALMVLLAAVILTGESPTFAWLLLPVALGAHVLLNTGIAFVMARAGFSVRDLGEFMQHAFRLLFYGSAILFVPSQFIDDESLLWLFTLNPVYDMVMAYRWILLDLPEVEVEWLAIVMLGVYAAVLPVIGFWYFIRAEHRYGS